jgi:hypothetical protein
VVANINPMAGYQGNYPMYGVKTNGQVRSSYDFVKDVINDIDIEQAELKVRILADKLTAYDTTPEQKYIIQAMLNDAKRELAQLQSSGKNNL